MMKLGSRQTGKMKIDKCNVEIEFSEVIFGRHGIELVIDKPISHSNTISLRKSERGVFGYKGYMIGFRDGRLRINLGHGEYGYAINQIIGNIVDGNIKTYGEPPEFIKKYDIREREFTMIKNMSKPLTAEMKKLFL